MLRKTHRGRLPLLAVIPCLAVLVLALRLCYLQVIRNEHYTARAEEQHHAEIPIRPKRGDILTSDGVALAVSTPAYAVYAETRLIESDHRALARRLAMILGKSPYELDHRLKSGAVITLARKIDSRTMQRIDFLRQEFGLSRFALRFEEEGKRHYPHGEHAAHVVGYVGLDQYGDNLGLDGVEMQYDGVLRGSLEQFEVARDAVQKRLEPVAEEAYRRAFGDTIHLTIDSAIQFSAERALGETCAKLSAQGGAVVVTEIKTGRILAMASWPTFDLNSFSRARPEERLNRCVSHAVEPGSVAKIFTMSLLINERLVTPATLFDCEGGRAKMGRRIIKDAPGHYLHVASIRDIFRYSSNAGTNKAAALMDGSRFYEGLRNLGLGEPTDCGLPGETAAWLPPLAKWSGLTMTSLPIGYEYRVTPVQVARAVGAIANNGIMLEPYVVEQVRGQDGRLKYLDEQRRVRRVIDPYASQQMIALMEAVVEEGTGTKAAVKGFRIGGKTGTAHKYDVEAGGYTPGKYYSSFCGVFPLSDPQFFAYVLIDEPRGMKWGGDVAAPVFQTVASDVLRVRGIRPDAVEPREPAPADALSALAEAQSRRTERFLAEAGTIRDPDLPVLPVPPEIESDPEDSVEPPSAPTEPAPLSREEQRERRRRELLGLPVLNPEPMPDVRGMTMAEVRDKLPEKLISRYEFTGSGVVVVQMPEAGTMLQTATVVVLRFADPFEVTSAAPAEPVEASAPGA